MEDVRTIGVAMDFSPCSKAALRWALENLVRDGDRLVLLHVHKDVLYEGGEMQLWEATGSHGGKLVKCKPVGFFDNLRAENGAKETLSLIPLTEFSDPVVAKKYGVKPDAETLDILNTVASQKDVIIVMKIYWGDAREKLCESVNEVFLSSIVIGSRGLGKIKRVLLGSVSNHVVNTATCPVTVVKAGDHHA